MSEENKTKPAPADIVAGGEYINAATQAGGTLRVFVRQVKPSELLAYLESEAISEERVLAMVCRDESGNPVDLDELTLEGYEALIEADQRQNFTAARKREKREGERAARQMEALRETNPAMHAKIIESMGAEMKSIISSLTPQPEGAEAGGNSPQKPPSPS